MLTAIKIEIIVSKAQSNKIIDLLEKSGIYEYTILDIYKGRGNKDGVVSHSVNSATENVYMFSVVKQELKQKAIELIYPYFKTSGGLFVISDVTVIDP
ncbi:MAG: P-II family nitrogen regulator [Cytophagales bacterium]|nr:P-II family nitrogen regulator [Cytophagales bacterium]